MSPRLGTAQPTTQSSNPSRTLLNSRRGSWPTELQSETDKSPSKGPYEAARPPAQARSPAPPSPALSFSCRRCLKPSRPPSAPAGLPTASDFITNHLLRFADPTAAGSPLTALTQAAYSPLPGEVPDVYITPPHPSESPTKALAAQVAADADKKAKQNRTLLGLQTTQWLWEKARLRTAPACARRRSWDCEGEPQVAQEQRRRRSRALRLAAASIRSCSWPGLSIDEAEPRAAFFPPSFSPPALRGPPASVRPRRRRADDPPQPRGPRDGRALDLRGLQRPRALGPVRLPEGRGVHLPLPLREHRAQPIISSSLFSLLSAVAASLSLSLLCPRRPPPDEDPGSCPLGEQVRQVQRGFRRPLRRPLAGEFLCLRRRCLAGGGGGGVPAAPLCKKASADFARNLVYAAPSRHLSPELSAHLRCASQIELVPLEEQIASFRTFLPIQNGLIVSFVIAGCDRASPQCCLPPSRRQILASDRLIMPHESHYH